MDLKRISRPLRSYFGLFLVTLLWGCSSTGSYNPCAAKGANPAVTHDPYEACNRKVYTFNHQVDTYVTKPLAKGYQTVLPSFVRRGINHFFSNLGEIPTLVNDALQGEMKQAGISFWRLAINTTVGVGGLFDVASSDTFALPKHDNDFGLTLAHYGYTDSAYVVLPFVGPSTVRDGMGELVDFTALSAQTYLDDDAQLIYDGVYFLHERSKLLVADAAIEQALDPYVFMRSAYMQQRRVAVDSVIDDLDRSDDDEDGDDVDL